MFGSTSIRSTVVTGQTEGLRVGFKEWVDGWAVCEVWADRRAEGEGKGGVKV